MAVHILGDSEGACLMCSTTDWAFGPVFSDREAAEQFLDWHQANYGDPRSCNDKTLQTRYSAWLVAKSEAFGECYWCDKLVYKDQASIVSRGSRMHAFCAEKHEDEPDQSEVAPEVTVAVQQAVAN